MSLPDFTSVVAKNWKRTTGYIVTGREPCITIGQDEVAHVERRLVLVGLDEAPRLKPVGSWFMAILVCVGDELEGLATWARGVEADRVHFYLHAEASPKQLKPWLEAGLPLAHVDDGTRSWASLHKRLGWDLNVRVFDDHAS